MGNDLPLIRNNGRYGQLGNWGRKTKRIPRKRLVLLIILLSLSTVFLISKNGGPIGFVQGDYNTSYTHTRTVIFNDTGFQGPVSPGFFSSGFNDLCSAGVNCVSSSFQTSGNDLLFLSAWTDGSSCSPITVTDTQGNTWTAYTTGGWNGNAIAFGFSATSSQAGTDIVTENCGGVVSGYTVLVYRGFSAFGNENDTTATTSPSVLTLQISANSVVFEPVQGYRQGNPAGTLAVPANVAIRHSSLQSGTLPGGRSMTENWTDSGPYLAAQKISQSATLHGPFVSAWHSLVELKGFSGPQTLIPSSRWTFNQTCVKNPGTSSLNFTYSTGTLGKGGANCSSADVAITLASVNLQTAAAKMLEIEAGIAKLAADGSASLRFDIVLRTNGTLPSFTENYFPYNDTQARAIWSTCWTSGTFATKVSDSVCSNALPSVQGFFIAHDQSKTIFQEGLKNDLIIASGQFTNNGESQLVLNFTGPNNFINVESGGSSFNAVSSNSASQLQFGQDYYILLKATFDIVNVAPAANVFQSFYSTSTGGLPKSFAIFSVPSSCNDPKNTTPCGLGTPQPTFNFNPLDPSSWGNAIIKGLLWVFTVAVPAAFVVAGTVIATEIQLVGNFIGQHLGWGNVGDNIVTFFTGLPPLFVQIGTALGWISSLVTNSVSSITTTGLFASPYFTGLANFLNDFKNAVGSGIILNLLAQIAFWFPTSYMIILITFYFLFVFMNGLRGFFDWIHLVKWSAFSLANIFSRFLQLFIKLITAILGRLSVISPGHEFPKIPHLNPGALPKINFSFNDIALFDDPTAWFLAFTGFIFTMMWAGTSAAGLPANTQTIIQSMSTLFLTLFGVGFMILILYIPGFLLAKLYQKGILEQ